MSTHEIPALQRFRCMIATTAVVLLTFGFMAEARADGGAGIGNVVEFAAKTIPVLDAKGQHQTKLTLISATGKWPILRHDKSNDLLLVDIGGTLYWIDPLDIKGYSIDKALVDKAGICAGSPGGAPLDAVSHHSHGSGGRKCK